MIPEVRNRKVYPVQDTMKNGMARLEYVMGDSLLKFKLMPSKFKIIFGLTAVFSLCFYLYLGKWLFSSEDERNLEGLLNTEKCPACFGSSSCGLFYYNQIKFSGMSKFRMLDMLNSKNVHFAGLARSTQRLTLKKLSGDSELREKDNQICKDANRPEDCDVARVFPITNTVLPLLKKPITTDILKNTGSFMFFCPSYRLLDRMWTYYKEFKRKGEILSLDKMEVFYISMVNPEPLMLQTFPKHEGWPFPEYIGACGRVVLEENAGTTLEEFYHYSFPIRAALAYQLMKIADTLTKKSDFILYLTDVSYENFAVDESLKVTVIDLEHILVVDKLAVKARAPAGWNTPYESVFDDCEGKNCLLFSRDELCTHEMSDHNYYAICRNILSRYAAEPNMEEGLLHDMTPEAEDYWDLGHIASDIWVRDLGVDLGVDLSQANRIWPYPETLTICVDGTLLDECARPSQVGGRLRVKDKLIRALEALKDGSKEHLDTIDTKHATRGKTVP